MKIHKLVLLRHGQSQWNLENRFTGWTDVNLTNKGVLEAKMAGKLLFNEGFQFDLIFTSVLIRAIKTMQLCLKEMNLSDTPKQYSWRLNERHYGALQGLNKIETAKIYGDDQVHTWRRSYNILPPKLKLDDKRHPSFDKKYKSLDSNKLPSSECLKDTVKRILPLWNDKIAPQIRSGKKILIVAHGNSLRALIKHLDNVPDEKIINLNIPTGIPLVYEINHKMETKENYYIGNQVEIKKRTKNIINQGKSK